MRISVWVETAQEVSVDVSTADFIAALAAKSAPECAADVGAAVSAAVVLLRELRPEMIGIMSPKQRRIVGEALQAESARWLATQEPAGDAAGEGAAS